LPAVFYEFLCTFIYGETMMMSIITYGFSKLNDTHCFGKSKLLNHSMQSPFTAVIRK